MPTFRTERASWPAGQTPWLAVLAGLCTCLIGLGLARFAYAPLVPALIASHWFTPAQAGYLGAANIAGYLAGAASARLAGKHLGARTALRLCMMLATASFFACVRPAGFAWFALWRFLSGLAGAGLTILAAPSILPVVPAEHRGRAGGIIFTGVGIGMVASGTILPALLRHGLPAAWLVLGGACLALTAIAWRLLPADATPGVLIPAPLQPPSPALTALNLAYAISAAGQVPAILFIADFVARGRALGIAAGADVWAVFGLGALAAPAACGAIADRIGTVWTLRLLWMTQIAAAGVLTVASAYGVGGLGVVAAAGAVAGAGIPGLVVLVLGRSQALAGPDEVARREAWRRATLAFALGQALCAYSASFLFDRLQRYDLLFASSAVFMAVALGLGELSFQRAARPIGGGAQAARPASPCRPPTRCSGGFRPPPMPTC